MIFRLQSYKNPDLELNLSNPYNAPTADLSQVAEHGQTYSPELLTVHGRIGRFRYLAYTFLLTIVATIVLGLAAVLLGLISPMLAMLSLILVIPVVAVSFIMAKRRFNDFDRSGWWVLLSFVPVIGLIVSLVLVFYPGDKGTNDFGLPPEENSTAVKVGAWIVIVLMIGGIIAGIASIPYYTEYIEKVKAAQVASDAASAQLEDAAQ